MNVTRRAWLACEPAPVAYHGTGAFIYLYKAAHHSHMTLKYIDPFRQTEIAKWAEVVKRVGIKVE